MFPAHNWNIIVNNKTNIAEAPDFVFNSTGKILLIQFHGRNNKNRNNCDASTDKIELLLTND